MKILKNFFILFIIIYLKSPVLSDENKIVIKVDQKIISSYEIKNKINTELMLRNLEINQLNIDRMKNFAVKSLIDFRIKENEIIKYDIKIDEIDLSKQLMAISSGNIEMFKEKFLINNLNFDIFIKELKLQAAWQGLILSLYQNQVKINEEELISEIKDLNKTNSRVKSYDLSEIEVSFTNARDKEEKIKEINKSIKETGFENSVSLHSEAESAINKGLLGLVDEKTLSKEIYNKLNNLKEGEISEPIIQLNRITFLKINKIKISNNNLDINDIKKNLINSKKNNLLNLYSKSHLSKLKNNSYIEFK